MDNDPDAALVDSFFLPGGILDPESYEQDEEKTKQNGSSTVEPIHNDNGAKAPVTFQRFTPTAIDPDNPWATSEIIPHTRNPVASTPPGLFATVHTANTSILQVKDCGLNPALNDKPIMAPPPGFESSIPAPTQQIRTAITPMVRLSETFEEDESIACSVPRELIPSHQEKDSIYGDGSSTSSLSHSTCGTPAVVSTIVQGEDEGLMLEIADDQQISERHRTNKTKQKEDEVIDIKGKNKLIDNEKVLANKVGKDVEELMRKQKFNGDGQRKEPQEPSEEEKKPKPVTYRENTTVGRLTVESQALADEKQPAPKIKKRRGNKRVSSTSNKSKSQQHELRKESQPISNQKHTEEINKRSASNKLSLNDRPKVHRQKPKNVPAERTSMQEARSYFAWKKLSWANPFPFTLTQQQQQAIRIFLMTISFIFLIFHAAIAELCINPSSLYVYSFFWTYPNFSREVLIHGLSFPHWLPHFTTFLAIWNICTPETTLIDKRWFWRLFHPAARRSSKSKMESSPTPKINIRHCSKQRLVVVLYTARLIAACGFIYDGFSQPNASIFLHLSPSSRTLVAYILLVIKRGWYQSPLLLIWGTMVQCVMKCIFYYSNPTAVLINTILGLALLHYKKRTQERIDSKRPD